MVCMRFLGSLPPPWNGENYVDADSEVEHKIDPKGPVSCTAWHSQGTAFAVGREDGWIKVRSGICMNFGTRLAWVLNRLRCFPKKQLTWLIIHIEHGVSLYVGCLRHIFGLSSSHYSSTVVLMPTLLPPRYV